MPRRSLNIFRCTSIGSTVAGSELCPLLRISPLCPQHQKIEQMALEMEENRSAVYSRMQPLGLNFLPSLLQWRLDITTLLRGRTKCHYIRSVTKPDLHKGLTKRLGQQNCVAKLNLSLYARSLYPISTVLQFPHLLLVAECLNTPSPFCAILSHSLTT